MKLVTVDWLIVLATLLICFVPALFFGKRAGKNTSEFFASGRSVPWWLAGLSMVATTFSSDTPNWVTRAGAASSASRATGSGGRFMLTGVATVFFFARLWRRSGVMTDLEFYELRYSGKAAGVVRGFRAVYLGLFFNCFIMGTVMLAACKIANILFGLPPWQTIVICGVLNVVFAAHAGLWGVLVIDMIQFFIKMTAVIAAAYFCLKEVARQTGIADSALAGLQQLVNTLGSQQVTFADGSQPVCHRDRRDAASRFSTSCRTSRCGTSRSPSSSCRSRSAGGPTGIRARSRAAAATSRSACWRRRPRRTRSAARSSSISRTTCCGRGRGSSPRSARSSCFPSSRTSRRRFLTPIRRLIGHDSAFPAMLKFLPVGFAGLMVGGLIAANSSTILTHLNWGASYLVHDFYRRFIAPDATEKHYVQAGRICTVLLYVFAGLLSLHAGVGAGRVRDHHQHRRRYGPACICCAGSGGASTRGGGRGDDQLVRDLRRVLFRRQSRLLDCHLRRPSSSRSASRRSAGCWPRTSARRPTSRNADRLLQEVHPSGPGWGPIRRAAGVSEAEAAATATAWGWPRSAGSRAA